MSSPADGLSRLLEVFDLLKISYAIGGSVASSTHGIPRTTLDVDLVVRMRADDIAEVVNRLHAEFYADAEQMRVAFARGRAANLIHLKSAWKFDLFPLQEDEYSRVEFGRRLWRKIQLEGGAAVECAVASAEDTVLRKLEWYRAGGEASERQWNDLLGVCRTVGKRMDSGYLRKWAAFLKIAELLEELLAEAASAFR